MSTFNKMSNSFRICTLACLLLFFLFMYGCAGHDPPPKMVFAKDAITIRYKADPELNMVNNRPHSLLLIVYQLSSLNAFNNYTGDGDGLVKLLDGKLFDKSVTAVHKYFIEPGSHDVLVLDRAEHTRHVAIVGGFNNLIPEKCSVVANITTSTHRHGLLLTKKTTVDPMIVNLVLGKEGMRLERENNDS